LTFLEFLRWSQPWYVVGLWCYFLITVVESVIHRTWFGQWIDLSKRWHLAVGETVLHVIIAALIWPFIIGVWLYEKRAVIRTAREDKALDRRRIVGADGSVTLIGGNIPPRAERRRQGRAGAKVRAANFGSPGRRDP